MQKRLNKTWNLNRAQPVSWASCSRFGQSEGVNLPILSSLLFSAFVFSFKTLRLNPALTRNSRHVFDDPDHHLHVRQQICFPHFSKSGHLSAHFKWFQQWADSHLRTTVTLLRTTALQNVCKTMSPPNSYDGYVEIAAAEQLYNFNINVVVST